VCLWCLPCDSQEQGETRQDKITTNSEFLEAYDDLLADCVFASSGICVFCSMTALMGCRPGLRPVLRAFVHIPKVPIALETSSRNLSFEVANAKRCFSISPSRHRIRHTADKRIKGLGKEIADEYAALREKYGKSKTFHGCGQWQQRVVV